MTKTHRRSPVRSITERLKNDIREFYSPDSMVTLLGVTAISAGIANTPVDDNFRGLAQDHVRSSFTDNVSFGAEKFGNGLYVLPAIAGGWLIGQHVSGEYGEKVSEWGERSLRAFAVGSLPLLAMQFATGGSRPGESSGKSEWKPLADNNGVSGHSFIGAMPFLSMAKMTDNFGWKAGLIVASTLPAMSRINDNKHYLSQAIMGWTVAWLATEAVDRSSSDEFKRHEIFPYFNDDGIGIGVDMRY